MAARWSSRPIDGEMKPSSLEQLGEQCDLQQCGLQQCGLQGCSLITLLSVARNCFEPPQDASD